jgi:hypothetical protein
MKRVFQRTVDKSRGERGGILVIAIVVILAMLILAIPFLFKLSGQWRSTERSSRSSAAFNLAEAGIDKVLWQMNSEYLVGDPIVFTYVAGVGTATMPGMTAAGGNVIGDIDLKIGPLSGTDPLRQPLEGTGKVVHIADRLINRTARVMLEQYFGPIWDFGFFVDDHFHTQNGNFFMDSYDSRDGAYGGANSMQTDVSFGTNNDEDQSWWIEKGGPSSDIYGTLAFYDTVDPAAVPPNPVDNPDSVIQVPKPDVFHVDEPKTILASPFDLPSVNPVDLPTKLEFAQGYDFKQWFTPAYVQSAQGLDSHTSPPIPALGDLSDASWYKDTLSSTTLTPTSGSGIYSSFVIGRGQTVTVSGGDVGVMVTGLTGANGLSTQGKFWVDSGTLVIEPGSSLTLILGNTSFKLENNTDINPTGEAPQFYIFGMDQFTSHTAPYNNAMYIENNGIIKAAIYVPRADMISTQGRANIDLYGAALAYSMDFKTNTNFHYDEALGESDNFDGGLPKWRITSWQEVLK